MISHVNPLSGLATGLCAFLSLGLLFASGAASCEDERDYVMTRDGTHPKPVVAVDNVCAWPNLTVLPDGTIVATIHNQPSHLKIPADVECWASEDGGRTWKKRGMPAPRDNGTVARGNVAAGVARNGDLVVITAGWSDPVSKTRGIPLPPIVSRSTDGGRSWTIDPDVFPAQWPEVGRSKVSPVGSLTPFGDILQGEDGDLRVGLYGGPAGAAFVYRSRDDGKTWADPAALNNDAIIYEPALLHLGHGKWLAAARRDGLDLYTSEDDAKTWVHRKTLTGPAEHPGHFTRLNDGRVLLSYGNRVKPKGVDVRFSEDEGTTWSAPLRVVDFQGDGGYPSSLQLPDGQVLTAYYAERIEGHNRYHMGVVVWEPTTPRGR